jgi:hypothetical protein
MEASEYEEDQSSFMIQPDSSNIRFVRTANQHQKRPMLNTTTTNNDNYNDDDNNNNNDRNINSTNNNNYNNQTQRNNSFPLPSTPSRRTRKPPQLIIGHNSNHNLNNDNSNNNYNNHNYSSHEEMDANRLNNNNIDNDNTMTSFRNIDWNDELRRFYIAIQKPEKISGITMILDAWVGKEDEMLQSLIDKYHDDIPNYMIVHLELIFDKIETGTESSFIKKNQKQQRNGGSNGLSHRKKNLMTESSVEKIKSNKSVGAGNGRR